MEKAVLFQKQIRDNAQDLHSYMNDLSSWEKEMKRKESDLTGEPIEQVLPPVRSKTKKSKPVNSKPKQQKKIAGCDFSAWDKFDAEKACELVDEEDTAPTSYDGKMSTEQKLEKLKEEAQEENEKGNRFVKLQKWDDAIACYTRAMALDKSDARYFANRGLCYQKKENLHAAEADCTRALALDPKYLKALMRRSSVRAALGSLRSSASDLREILEIDPNSLVARKQLAALTLRMGTKGPNSKSSPATTPSTEEAPANGLLNLRTAGGGDAKKAVLSETDKSPPGEPGTEVSGQVLPITIPPHLRSKEKACELVDEEDIAPTSYDGKMSTEQKLEKLKEEAQEENEKGNRFVKLQKWDDAIACYTRAMALDKSDARYFANRGLCYQKKENLHAAEADCTRALALDPKYLKALMRRSSVRASLGSLRSSASDLREILEIDPNSLVARKQLAALTLRMGTKGPNSKSSPATTPSTEEAPANGLLNARTAGGGDAKKAVISETDKSPPGEPGTEVSGQVLPITIPPHLRSKKPLIRIPVMEIPLGVSNPKTTPKSPADPLQEQVLIRSPDDSVHLVEKESKIIKSTMKLSNGLSDNWEQSQNIINGKQDTNDVTKNVTSITTEAVVTQLVTKAIDAPKTKLNGTQITEIADIKSLQLNEVANNPLQVPKSSVQFISQWRLLRGRDKERSKYLRAIPPNQLPTIFQNFLESDTLSEIVATLHSGEDFVQANSNALPYLHNLAAVKRFSALAMFLSKKDKNDVLEILQRCQKTDKCSKQEFTELKTKYEL